MNDEYTPATQPNNFVLFSLRKVDSVCQIQSVNAYSM